MRAKHFIFWIVALLAVGAVCVVLLRRGHPDLSGEEAPFNAMAMPPQEVGGGIFMDGGSVWVCVVDAKGRIFDLAFPYDDSGSGT